MGKGVDGLNSHKRRKYSDGDDRVGRRMFRIFGHGTLEVFIVIQVEICN